MQSSKGDLSRTMFLGREEGEKSCVPGRGKTFQRSKNRCGGCDGGEVAKKGPEENKCGSRMPSGTARWLGVNIAFSTWTQ